MNSLGGYGEDPRIFKAIVNEKVEKAADEYLKWAASLDPQFKGPKGFKKSPDDPLWSGQTNVVLVPETISRDLYDYLWKRSWVRQLFEFVKMPTKDYKWAVQSGIIEIFYRALETAEATSTQMKVPTFGTPIELHAKELFGYTGYTDIASEDAAFNVTATVLRTLGNSFKEYEENAFLNGDVDQSGACAAAGNFRAATCAFDGLKLFAGTQEHSMAEAMLTADLVAEVEPIFQDQGVGIGQNAIIANAFVINKWVTSEDFKTWDKIGPKATLITGQVGQFYDMRVFQSRHMLRYVTTTKNLANTIIVDPAVAAVGGDMRNYTMERDRNIKAQMWELVATERIAWTKARPEGVFLFKDCLAEGTLLPGA